MDATVEINGRMLATQLLVAGLIARVANEAKDPLTFLSDFRDEIRAVVSQVRISGGDEDGPLRQVARATIDELFSLMKAPSEPEPDAGQRPS